MKYPIDFRRKVIDMYPNNTQILRNLNTNKAFLGSLLEGAYITPSITPEIIIEAFESGNEKDILRMARERKKRKDLYDEWFRIYRKSLEHK